MTLTTSPIPIYCEEDSKEYRRDMMNVMSEVSFNPANVVPDRQEQLASFMVSELRSFSDEVEQ